MKLCLITEYFFPEDTGGTPTILSDLLRYLKDRYADLEIDVITSNNLYRRAGGKLPAFEHWDGINIIRVNSPRSNRPSTALRLLTGCVFAVKALARLRRAHAYDLLVVGTNPPAAPSIGAYARRHWGLPYCYLIHDLYPDIAVGVGAIRSTHPVAKIAARFQRDWLQDAPRILVLGRCMRDHLVEAYAVPAAKIDVLPNWADARAITPVPTTDSRFRAQHALSGFLVVYGGNIGRSQGLDSVLDAAKCLARTHPHITFALVGAGDAQHELQARAVSEGITNVRFFAPVTPAAYPDLLAAADVSLVSLDPQLKGLAVPSKFYNILASGRPTIAIVDPASEVARVLAEANCGLQVAHGQAQQIAEAIIHLAEHPDLCVEMGSNARRILMSAFTIAPVSEQFARLFHEVAATGPARRPTTVS